MDAKRDADQDRHGEVLDRDAILAQVGGDEELLRDLAQTFLDDCTPLLDQIRNAVTSGDLNRLARSAHNLKGSVSNFSRQATFEAALRLEQMGRTGDAAESAEALRDLEHALEQLRPALARLARPA